MGGLSEIVVILFVAVEVSQITFTPGLDGESSQAKVRGASVN
jgi:hypothetical protein